MDGIKHSGRFAEMERLVNDYFNCHIAPVMSKTRTDLIRNQGCLLYTSNEVDMKTRPEANKGLGVKIFAALTAGAVVASEVAHGLSLIHI